MPLQVMMPAAWWPSAGSPTPPWAAARHR